MPHLKLATLNLWHYAYHRAERLERTAAWIQDSDIDVLCLQEVTHHDGRLTSEILADVTGWHHATPPATPEGDPARTAVLTRVSPHHGELLVLPGSYSDGLPSYAAVTSVPTATIDLLVVSLHLAWGSLHEVTRLRQLQAVVSYVDERLGDTELPAVIAGDMNTLPESDSMRYLRGLTALAPQTLWVDAWERRLDPADAGDSSSSQNLYARYTTAQAFSDPNRVIIDPSLTPDRRIDAIFSRGWAYARPFSPSRTQVVREPLMSDHYPVVTELLLP